eukprot:9488805-Pyramimonas_sp.AAC.1
MQEEGRGGTTRRNDEEGGGRRQEEGLPPGAPEISTPSPRLVSILSAFSAVLGLGEGPQKPKIVDSLPS